ncbi:T-cell surface protein tactile [Rhinatrema bivittatum]|uniref:T-cell surface protein tactile n=1 Tax=Rhinatrema bivittatum TaxID=194408 RepID=UPI00112B777D|nr:T-cell surface protein tactile [Rhinatrema bivittatum]
MQDSMKKRWAFSALHAFITYLCASGQLDDNIETEEVVRAAPGSDVTFKCTLTGNLPVTQVQWSRMMAKKQTMIAVHNPNYGTAYGSLNGSFHNISASFDPPNTWTLHVAGVTSSLAGQYLCNFATYPNGSRDKIINLFVQKEEETHSVLETLLNETFEIQCLENISSVHPSVLSWEWSVEENGSQSPLFSSEHHAEGAFMLSGNERIQLLKNYTLSISAARALEDGRSFFCYLETQQKRIKSTTTLKVFAVPEISVTLRNVSSSKVNLSCVVGKAYPKPNIIWYKDEVEIFPDKGEISVVRDEEGLFTLMSVISLNPNQSAKNRTFWCTALLPLPGKPMQRIPSERISITLYQENKVMTSSPMATTINEGLQMTTSTTSGQTRMTASLPDLGYTTSTPVTRLQKSSVPNITGSAFDKQSIWEPPNDNTTTESSISSIGSLTKSETSGITHDRLSTVKAFSEVSTVFTSTTGLGSLLTTGKLLNSTSDMGRTPAISWPALVSVLLLICTILVIFMIRRWCQYRREIMDRPPPFKPPPPPIKYASMQDSDGTESSCHELENL